ncbi:hypothetical protein K504DRAFT_460334 [Pleomassaria siparia CBS 279.74]|uniref:Uncharacterized protein n=1 Tax=Pleomassaria siparia CBS 279.74 TaxID=1314801 RepID=A0A6G1JZI2_9PLEO|nr:hypothetical protein K504DRAFT_460334 [Pleomassaria siparia CBS 279.74]
MPRPKRTKIASTTTTTRVAKPPKVAAPTARQTQRDSRVPARDDSSLSDDSDGLVVKATQPRRRMPWYPEKEQNVDLTMTGALPVRAAMTTGITASRKGSPRVTTSNIHQTPSSEVSKRSRASNGSAVTEELSPVESRPAATTPDHVAPVEDNDSSGFGDNLLTFTSLDSESPAHGTRPPSAIKVGATPAHETSILALTNFRRRARQPSLLRMVHQTTDVEDNEIDDMDDLDNLDDLDDLDDFQPEHESTPLHLHKSVHEVEVANNSGLNLSSSGSRGRKRKLSSPVIQVPRSSPPYDPPSGADITESRATSPSLPDDVLESREGVAETQEDEIADAELMSETMAPPRSSSSLVDEIEDSADSPVKARQSRTRGAPTKANQYSEENEIDRRGKPKVKSKSKAHHGISTAKLQSLLPRRRTRVPQERDEFDMDDSDAVDITPIDSDQDELHMPHPRQATARRGPVAKPGKNSTRTAKKPAPATKPTQKNTRTYGRRVLSDKENEHAEGLGDDSDAVEDTAETSITLPESELAAIAAKFEDVDAWEMDFESVDANGDDSSPWR